MILSKAEIDTLIYALETHGHHLASEFGGELDDDENAILNKLKADKKSREEMIIDMNTKKADKNKLNPFRLTPDGFIQCYSTNRKTLDPWIMWSYSGGFNTKDIVDLYGRWLDGEFKGIAPYLPTPPSIKGKDIMKKIEIIIENEHECVLKNELGDTYTYSSKNEELESFLMGCRVVETNHKCEEALSKILKVGASLLTTGISGEISEWDLPKNTPIKAKRKIVQEADKWNDINRLRAIELKNAYDVLSQHFS